MARRDVSDGRKFAFYLGTAVSAVGLVLFLSVFVTTFGAVGGAADPGDVPGAFARAPIGFILIIVGQFIRSVGARGAAGSGLVLDPKQAREDLEPWARMGGGMVGDALDEAGIELGRSKGGGAAGDEWAGLPLDERLRRLHALHTDGILSAEEYEREKRELLEAGG